MRVLAVKKSVKCLIIEGKDFYGDSVSQTNWRVSLAKNLLNHSCSFRTCGEHFIDYESGSSVELQYHVVHIFDNEGKRPTLIEIIDLAEQAKEIIYAWFVEEVAPKLIPSWEPFHLFDMSNMIELVSKELDNCFPLSGSS